MHLNPRREAAEKGYGETTTVQPFQSSRQLYKRFLAGGLFHSRLLHLVRRFEATNEVRFVPGARVPRIRIFSGSKFAILCYHRIGLQGVPYHSRLAPEAFEAQMLYLKRYYRIVSLSVLHKEVIEGGLVPPTVAITFDDGYRDLYSHAFPVLRRLGIPATVYLIGECMQSGTAPWYDRIFSAIHRASGSTLTTELNATRTFRIESFAERSSVAWQLVCFLRSLSDSARREWCRDFEGRHPVCEAELENRMLTWEQVREMFQAGISFGAHTWTHPSVSRLSFDSLERELGETKAFLETGLHTEVRDFAYPFGKSEDCSSSAEQVLAKLQYRSAVTTSEGINSSRTHPFRLRRFQVGDSCSLSMFAFAVTQLLLESTEDSILRGDDSTQQDPPWKLNS